MYLYRENFDSKIMCNQDKKNSVHDEELRIAAELLIEILQF